MPVPVLEAIADAIMRYEGWEPGSISYQNRNPGNLRAVGAGEIVDARGFRVFSTFLDGYRALLTDLTLKVTGKGAHKVSANSTLYQFFSVYAPWGNDNAPFRYAEFVAGFLNRVYGRKDILPSWSIAGIFVAAGQELPVGVAAA